jgi:uncharacterized membrane protein HdeD (DUF308 family)
MDMLRAGLAVAAMFIGAIAALMGAIMIISALKTGAVQFSYGSGGNVVSETVTRAADAARYWRFVAALGIAPVVFGVVAARWGWQTIDR